MDFWINQVSLFSISTYRPLSGSSYVKSPSELKRPKRGLTNIKNNDQKCFLWCQVRHVYPVKIHSEIITREDKNLLIILIMMLLGFLCEKKILARLKGKTIFVLMCIVMKTKWFLNLHFRSKILKLNGFVACNLWKQVTLRIHQRFGQIYVSQNKTKTKNTFAKVICSVLSVKCVLLVKHKKLFWALMVHNL